MSGVLVVSAPVSSVSIPTVLAGTVVGIGGLDTSNRKKPSHVGGPESAKRVATATTSVARPSDVLPPPDLVFRNGTPCSAFYGQKAANTFP